MILHSTNNLMNFQSLLLNNQKEVSEWSNYQRLPSDMFVREIAIVHVR